MARTDPERARKLIARLKIPQEQACGWALLALGLADRDQPAARAALAESIRLIDGLNGPRDLAERRNRGVRVTDNPAASILPIVEKVAPERLDEVFWKAVAQKSRGDVSVTFLARYDRQMAEAFLVQAAASFPLTPTRNVLSALAGIRARMVTDPRGAVAMFEALPPIGRETTGLTLRMFNQTRYDLITQLVEPLDEQWKAVWRSSGIPIDKERFR